MVAFYLCRKQSYHAPQNLVCVSIAHLREEIPVERELEIPECLVDFPLVAGPELLQIGIIYATVDDLANLPKPAGHDHGLALLRVIFDPKLFDTHR